MYSIVVVLEYCRLIERTTPKRFCKNEQGLLQHRNMCFTLQNIHEPKRWRKAKGVPSVTFVTTSKMVYEHCIRVLAPLVREHVPRTESIVRSF